MSDKPRRISIGFEGGQSLGLRLATEELDKLRKALGGDGWHEVAADDGAIMLDLTEVVYLKVESDEHRIGF